MISGSDDGTLRLWDFSRSNRLSRVQFEHETRVSCLALDAVSNRAITGSDDRTLRIWNIKTGTSHTLDEHADRITCLALDPIRDFVFSGDFGGTLRVSDLRRDISRTILNRADRRLTCLALDPMGSRLLIGSTERPWFGGFSDLVHRLRRMRLWYFGRRVYGVAWGSSDEGPSEIIRVTPNVHGGNSVLTSEEEMLPDALAGYADLVTCVALWPDGLRVASGLRDSTLRIWDLAVGNNGASAPREIVRLSNDSAVTFTAIAASDDLVVAGDSLGRLHFLRVEGLHQFNDGSEPFEGEPPVVA
jgi:WD40 repeat protein